MIQIRSNMFETNSSSCHVFVYKPDTNAAAVPAKVDLVVGSDDNIVNIIFNDLYRWYRPNDGEGDMWDFINCLYAIGVKKINCSDKSIANLAKQGKDGSYQPNVFSPGYMSLTEFKNVCFGDTTQCTTMQDELSMDEKIKKEFGDDILYTAMRLS